MAGWLQAAANAFGRGKPEPPEIVPYRIGCRCGNIVTGLRSDTSQVATCPECREVLFVLPTDVYPKTRPRKSAKEKAAPEKSSRPVPLSVVTADDDEGVSAPAADWHDEASADLKQKSKPAPASHAEQQRDVSPLRSRAPSWLRKQLTPVRLLAIVILVALGATGWLVRRAQLREEAEIVLRTRAEPLERLLASEETWPLEEELKRHAEAVRTLERSGDPARRILSLYRETIALNRLATVSLFDLVQEAKDAIPLGDVEWQNRFNLIHRGRWILLDAGIATSTNAAGQTVRIVDVPLVAGEHPVRLVADVEAFATASPQVFESPVFFAAQLDSCRLPTAADSAIVIELAPETVFFWEQPETLALAGLFDEKSGDAETVRKRLKAQQQLDAGPSAFLIAELQKSGLPIRKPQEAKAGEEAADEEE